MFNGVLELTHSDVGVAVFGRQELGRQTAQLTGIQLRGYGDTGRTGIHLEEYGSQSSHQAEAHQSVLMHGTAVIQ